MSRMEHDDDVVSLPSGKLKATAVFGDVLDVYVVPHSHQDVGWLEPMQACYDDAVQHILNLTVAWLHKHEDLKFQQAEMVFFEMWWARSDAEMRNNWLK